MQSVWEHRVQYNLSESGVHPLKINELVSKNELDEIMNAGLGYLQTNGTLELREAVCRMYPGSNPENVLVTTGSAEANYLLVWSHINPGDEVLFMLPNYMQIWGLLKGFGADVKGFYLKEELSWDPDPDELRKLFTEKTKIIIVTNPNNPTGARLSENAMNTIIECAGKSGAWIFSDEVYQGAELDGQITTSFWGKYEKAVITAGLSKAYGLPGLRAGWIVGPKELIQRTWAYHDYTTISLSVVSDRLARIVLLPDKRKKILERTRTHIRENYAIFQSWLERQNGHFACIPPDAGAIAFPRYDFDMNSTELIENIRKEKSVLIVPGDHFEMDRYIRFGLGGAKEELSPALQRIEEYLRGHFKY